MEIMYNHPHNTFAITNYGRVLEDNLKLKIKGTDETLLNKQHATKNYGRMEA
jgi:hypothetical protein